MLPCLSLFTLIPRRILIFSVAFALLVALCTAPVLAVDTHTHDDTWIELNQTYVNSLTSYTLTNGNYIVDGTVSLPQSLTISGEVTLCLNGGVLQQTGTSSVITVSSGATLNIYDCPNGAMHNFSKSSSLWKYNSTLTDTTYNVTGGVITGGNAASNGGGGIYVNGGTLNLYNGNIAGNTASSKLSGCNAVGGGVGVNTNAKFTMYGGTIAGNSVSGNDIYGGGIGVAGGGTLTIHGGTITHNDGSKGGGGIMLYSNTCSIANASITNNKAGSYVGGIWATGTVTLTNVTIKGNSGGFGVRGDASLTLIDVTITENIGGGLFVQNNDVTVSGKTNITGNIANSQPKNIALASGKSITINATQGVSGLTLGVTTDKLPTKDTPVTVATIKGGTVSAEEVPEIFIDDRTDDPYIFALSNDSSTINLVIDPKELEFGTEVDHQTHYGVSTWYLWNTTERPTSLAPAIVLTENVTINTTWVLKADTTLCLNGKTLSLSGSTGPVITVSGGLELTICDCNTTQQHRYTVDGDLWKLDENGEQTITGGVITGGSSDAGGGISLNGGTLILYGGNIIGNKATERGGGVYVSSGTFTMHGGTIAGNDAGKYGGGIEIKGGSFNTDGGTITANHAAQTGGGINMQSNNQPITNISITNNTAGTGGGIMFYQTPGTLTNVTIQGNSGGGIGSSAGNRNLPLTNVTITGNTGGGVSGFNLTVSGETKITNNTENGGTKNVYLKNGNTITINAPLTGDAKIGVTLASYPCTFTTATDRVNSDFFFADAGDTIYIVGTGEPTEAGTVPLLLGAPHQLTWDFDGATADDTVYYTEAGTVANGTYIVFPTLTYTNENMYLYGWNSASDTQFTGTTMPNTDLTLTAVWGEPQYTLTIPSTPITLSETTSTTADVTLTVSSLAETHAIDVSVQSGKGWKLVQPNTEDTIAIPYTMEYTCPDGSAGTVTGKTTSAESESVTIISEAKQGATTESAAEYKAQLTFSFDQADVLFAGEYADTLTFNIELAPVSAAAG